MRTLLLTAALILLPTAAFAYCPVVADSDSAVVTNTAQQQLIACQQNELHTTVQIQQQKLDLQSALAAQQQNFDLELRMQKTFDAAQPPMTFPQF